MKANRRPLLAWVAAALAAVLLSGCAGTSSAAPRFVPPAAGTDVVRPADRLAAPRLGGEDLAAGRLDIAALRGDVVVVNFWASWCAPCRVEAPELQALHEQTRGQGVRVIGINTRDDRTAARRFVSTKGLTYPSVYDRRGRNAALLSGIVPPSTLPSTLVLDRQQRVAARFLGQVRGGPLTTAVLTVLGEPR